MNAIEKALAAKAKANEKRAHEDGEQVLAWRQFIKAESAARHLVDAGELEREAWASMWADAPEPPSKAQYDNARRLGYIEPSYV